ncbi:MAG: hypothetical protein LC122_13015 [Chitinophagales bacterium]|nr:hypothetical protein [Chitinophagales bacterium]
MNPTKEQIEKLYSEEKLTLDQIANKFNISKTTMSRLLKKYNMAKICGKRVNQPTKEELIDLYQNKKITMQEIGEKFKINRITISRLLKKYKIEISFIPKKEELEDLYFKMNKNISDISKIYFVDRNTVSKWFNKYNIPTDLYTKSKKPSKEDLQKLYFIDNLTTKQIGHLYNSSRQTVDRWFKEYNLATNSNQKKFSHLRAVPLTKNQKEFIVGSMLGDGHIDHKSKKSNRLVFCHSEKQLDYLLWKKNIMKEYVNTVTRYEQKERNSICWKWSSIYLNDLKQFHTMFYDNNKKIIKDEIINYLTPFAMAVWFMDDGWINHGINMRISSESFTKEENEKLVNMIKINFDINAKVLEYTKNNKKYYYISFNKRNSILLSKLINEYVIDSMKYKLVKDCSSTTTC